MDHWPRHARQWALVGPPLRPDPDDVARMRAAVGAWAAAHGRPPRALLLGVTPELATMAWPSGTSLVAVDRSVAMIRAIFPRGAGAAVRGEWCALPIAASSIDLAVGDGCLSNLVFPDDYVAFGRELRRVLATDGRLIVRVFAAPPVPRSLDELPSTFHALKWRIAMAIMPPGGNVAVAAIRDTFNATFPDRAALAARTGWPREVIDAIDVYRDSVVRYSFPAEQELLDALGADLVRTTAYPGDDRGEIYPTLVFRPR